MKHLSDIKKFERCDKLYLLSKHDPQPYQAFVIYNENMVSLTLKRLGLKNYFTGHLGDSNDAFFNVEDTYDVFMNVRFEYYDLRVKIPIMVKTADGYDLYYTYPACYPKEGEAQSMADNEWVLDHVGIKVHACYSAYLNASYVREDNLDLKHLINIDTFLFNDRNHPGQQIAILKLRKKRNLQPILDAMDKTMECTYIEKERTSICTKRSKCTYFDTCFKAQEDTSIFHLVSSAKKLSLYEQGIHTIEQVNFDDIEGTRHQFAQYMAAREQKLFFDKAAVTCFFEKVMYPISYLDFEWETFAFPPYRGMKPYDVLAFQYSLHIEEQDGSLRHLDFLGKEDCREAFIRQLLYDIPATGSIFCFNVEGAEKLRLIQLAKQYPAYEEQLRAVWERMIDLSIPFSNGLIYDNRMAGMYSLKKLVSIFTDYSYDDLAISHGMEAVRSYISLEDDEEVVQNLLRYCAMDTYAMYLMYHWILKQ